MTDTLNVYLAVRMHYGHSGEAIRMTYKNYTRNVLVTIRDNNVNYPNYTQALLDAVRYLYATGLFKYPVKLISNNPSLIRVINHLQAWMKQGWPISRYTSHELFIYAKENGFRRISLRYIPRNYVKNIQLYQRIAKGFSYSSSPLRLNYCYPDNDEMAMLNAFTWNKIKDLPPTESFLNRLYAQDANTIKSANGQQILIDPRLKARFKSICDSSAKAPLNVIRALVLGYIRSNGGSGKNYDWKHDLYHRVYRCVKASYSWSDLTQKLKSYGIHAKVFTNQYLRSKVGHPFLKDIHYSFIDKRGRRINTYGNNVNKRLTLTALSKYISKNTKHQLTKTHQE